MANFETAGIKLELQGFSQFISGLSSVDQAQDKTAASSETLAGKLSGLEGIVANFFGTIGKLQINTNAMGFTQLASDSQRGVASLQGFSAAVRETTDVLQKASVAGTNINSIKTFSQVLSENASSVRGSFQQIEAAIRSLNFDDMANDFSRVTTSFRTFVDEFKTLDSKIGTNVIKIFGDLIPLLQQARGIGSLGNVGRSIGSLIKSFEAFSNLPDLSLQRENINVLLSLLRRFNGLTIPQNLGQDLTEIGQGFLNLMPGLQRFSQIAIDKAKLNQLFALFDQLSLLQTNKFDAQQLLDTANALAALSVAFRSFGSGKSGTGFALVIPGIISNIKILLSELERLQTSSNNQAFLTFITDLAATLKLLSTAFRSFGKDFANVGANFSVAMTNIFSSLSTFESLFNKFGSTLPKFLGNITDVGSAIKDLGKGFSSLSRSKTIQTDLGPAIASIISALNNLSNIDLGKLSKKLAVITPQIEAFIAVSKLLAKNDLTSQFAKLNADTAPSEFNIFDSLSKSIMKFLSNFGLDGIVKNIGTVLKLLGMLGKFSINTISGGFKALGTIINSLSAPIKGIATVFQAIGTAIRGLQGPIVAFGNVIRALASPILALAKPIIALLELISKIGVAFGKLFGGGGANASAKSLGISNLGLDQSSADFREFNSEVLQLQSTLSRTASSTNGASASIREVGQSSDMAGEDVDTLTNKLERLNNTSSNRRGIFGGDNELLRAAGTFKAVDIAADAVSDTIYGIGYGIQNFVKQSVQDAGAFENVVLQINALQAKEMVADGMFSTVTEAMTTGIDQVQARSQALIAEFRMLGIQSPFNAQDAVDIFKTANAMGFATDKARQLTKTILDTSTGLGLTAADGKALALVFGQISTAGKVQAQDLNQLAQRGINAKKILSEAFNVPADELAKSGIDVSQAIDVILNSLNKDWAGAAARAAGTISGLSESFQSFATEARRTFIQPVVEGFKPLFVSLADALFSPTLMNNFKASGTSVGQSFTDGVTESMRTDRTGGGGSIFDAIQMQGERLRDTLLNTVTIASSVAGVLTSIFQAIPAPVISFIGLLGKATAIALAATVAVVALAYAFGLIGAAITFAFVGNPIGIIVGIGVAVASVLGPLNQLGTTLTSLGQIINNTLSGDSSASIIGSLPEDVQNLGISLIGVTSNIQNFASGFRTIGIEMANAFNTRSFDLTFLSELPSQLQKVGMASVMVATDVGEMVKAFQMMGEFAQISFEMGSADSVRQEIFAMPEAFSGVAEMVAEVSAALSIAIETFGLLSEVIGEGLIGNLQAATEAILLMPEAFQGFAIGALNAIITVQTAFASLPSTIINVFAGIAASVSSFGASIVSSIYGVVSGISGAISGIVSSVSGIVSGLFGIGSNIASFLNGLIGQVASFGVGVVSAFAEGMISAVNLVVSAVNAIANAISFLLEPGSPPRALPEIDKWGEEAAGQFLKGFSDADTSGVTNTTDAIKNALENLNIDNASEIFPNLTTTTNQFGQMIDQYGNIIGLQNQLNESTQDYAKSLSEVEQQISLFDKLAALDQQSALVKSLDNTLKSGNLADASRLSLEQQLIRARLELQKQQLQLTDQEEKVADKNSQNTKDQKAKSDSGGGDSGGKGGGGSEEQPKEDKGAKGGAGSGGAGASAGELQDIGSTVGGGAGGRGGGLLGRVKSAFENAKEGIVSSVTTLRDSVVSILTSFRDRLIGVFNGIVSTIQNSVKKIQDSFNMTKSLDAGGAGNKGVIGAILGFNLQTWETDTGVILGNIAIFAEDIKSAFSTAFTVASDASTTGENPFTAFFTNLLSPDGELGETIKTEVNSLIEFVNSTFSLELSTIGNKPLSNTGDSSLITSSIAQLFNKNSIIETVKNNIVGLGASISAIFQGEMNTIFNKDTGIDSTGMPKTDANNGLGIASFIKSQIQGIKDALENFDLGTAFDSFKTNLQTKVDEIFGVGAVTGFTEHPLITRLKNFGKEIIAIGTESGTWSKAIDDLKQIKEELGEFFGLGSAVGGVAGLGGGFAGSGGGAGAIGGGVMTGAAIGILAFSSALSILTNTISIVSESLQTINSVSSTFQSLFATIGSFSTGDNAAGTAALMQTGTDLKAAIANFGDINIAGLNTINDITDAIVRLGAALGGVESPENFQQDAVALGALLDAIAGVLTGAALTRVAASAPTIIASLKSLNSFQIIIPVLIGIITVLNGLELQGTDQKTQDLNKFLDNLQVTLGYITALEFAGAALGKGSFVVGAFKVFLNAIRGLTIGGFAIPSTNNGMFVKIGVFIRNIITGISTAFAGLAGGAIGGVSLGTITTVGSVIVAAVGAVAGLYQAVTQNLGGLQTIGTNIIDSMFTGIEGILSGLDKIFNTPILKDKSFDANKQKMTGINEAISGIADVFLAVSNFGTAFGSPEGKINTAFAALEGILSLIDKFFGTNLQIPTTEKIFDPLREFFNVTASLGTQFAVNEAFGVGLETFLNNLTAFITTFGSLNFGSIESTSASLTNIFDKFGTLSGISTVGLDNAVITVLSLVDALATLAGLDLSKIGAAFDVILNVFKATSMPTASNIDAAIGSIANAISVANNSLETEATKTKSLVELFLENKQKLAEGTALAPIIKIQPQYQLLPDEIPDYNKLLPEPQTLKPSIPVAPVYNLLPDELPNFEDLIVVPDILRPIVDVQPQYNLLIDELPELTPQLKVTPQETNPFDSFFKGLFGTSTVVPFNATLEPTITNVDETREILGTQITESTALTGDTEIKYEFKLAPELSNKEEVPIIINEGITKALEEASTSKESVIKPLISIMPDIKFSEVLDIDAVNSFTNEITNSLVMASTSIVNFTTVSGEVMRAYAESTIELSTELSAIVIETNVTMAETVIETISTMSTTVISILNAMSSAAIAIFNSMRAGVVAAVNAMRSAVISAIASMVSEMISIMGSGAAAAANAFISALSVLPGATSAIMSQLISIFQSFAAQASSLGRNAGAAFAQGFIDGIESYLGAAANAGRSIARAAQSGVKTELGIRSPSKELYKDGEFAGLGFLNGITSVLDSIYGAGESIAESLQAGIASIAVAPILDNAVDEMIKQGGAYLNPDIKISEPGKTTDPGDVVEERSNVISKKVKDATKLLEQVGDSFGRAFDTLFDKLAETNPNIIGNVFAGDDAKQAAAQVAKKLGESIQQIADVLTPEGRKQFASVIRGIFESPDNLQLLGTDIVKKLGPEFIKNFPDIENLFKIFQGVLDDAFDSAPFLKKGEFSFLRDIVTKGFGDLTGAIKNGVAELEKETKDVKDNKILPDFIRDNFGDTIPKEVDAAVSAAADASATAGYEIGEQATAGIAAGITSPQSIDALQAAAESIFTIFVNQLRLSGEIRSPSKATMRLAGEPLTQGVVKGIKNEFPNVKRAATSLTKLAIKSVGKVKSSSLSGLVNGSLEQNVGLKYSGIINKLPSLTQGVNNEIIERGLTRKTAIENGMSDVIKNYSNMKNSEISRKSSEISSTSLMNTSNYFNSDNVSKTIANRGIAQLSSGSLSTLSNNFNNDTISKSIMSNITNAKAGISPVSSYINSEYSKQFYNQSNMEKIVNSAVSRNSNVDSMSILNSERLLNSINTISGDKVLSSINTDNNNEVVNSRREQSQLNNYAVKNSSELFRKYNEMGGSQHIRSSNLTNYSNVIYNNHYNESYNQYLTVSSERSVDARRNFRVAKQLKVRK